MDRATFEAEAARDGFKIVERTKPAGDANELHDHPFDARLFFLAGEMTVTFEDSAKTCRSGDVLEVAAGTRHREEVGPEGATYVAATRGG